MGSCCSQIRQEAQDFYSGSFDSGGKDEEVLLLLGGEGLSGSPLGLKAVMGHLVTAFHIASSDTEEEVACYC